ncbi:NAD(P)/FAD-dependent oxidoreductase [Shewanella sp. AS16]|uniref:NAD(P)/FAD-dependent oxidoreductase n=1 Tax=Shewanella sp. AS16 TaxID=2907625 RepID=UPI001F2E656F|nr:NAD(P)/FAD-dependent oxidoreductase [Shewanella sp. AS16]MCE9685019.1 NAD(P)/FAD-dependent oxidoreductase [Shewanella sp. AS16]
MEHIDTLVIGAGVVGLAIAARLSHSRSVLVIEKERHFGEHSSSRNSEVIHAGLYYPTDSLKARLCVRGQALFYEHCEQFKVPHRRIGKLLLAQNADEAQQLDAIARQARCNGVEDLSFLSRSQIALRAPSLTAGYGLWSPSTGIVDSQQFLLSLLYILELNGGNYVPNTEFIAARADARGFVVTLNCGGLNSDGERLQLHCEQLINAGGLFAQKSAKGIEGLAEELIPELHFCRGQYFSYQGQHGFKHLIYPVPEQHGLGIHATLDLAGGLKFGPDIKFIPALDYATDASAKGEFVKAIRRYWPALDETRLQPDYAGIRPKLQRHGVQDFVIQDATRHGIEGLINLFGIESPGLTASLAIAEYVELQLS